MAYINIKDAAKLLQVSVVTARKYISAPASIVTLANGNEMYLYDRAEVERIKERLEKERSAKKKSDPDVRKCRSCDCRMSRKEMVNGKCPDCKAFDLCRKYCCPDLCAKCLDENRVCKMAAAFQRVCERFKKEKTVKK